MVSPEVIQTTYLSLNCLPCIVVVVDSDFNKQKVPRIKKMTLPNLLAKIMLHSYTSKSQLQMASPWQLMNPHFDYQVCTRVLALCAPKKLSMDLLIAC